MMQDLAEGIEQLFTDVAKDVERVVGAVVEATEEFASQMQEAIAPDLEARMNEFFDPILEAYLGFEISVEELLDGTDEAIEASMRPMLHTVEPMLNEHSACVGCRHYHGQSYNGVMFVCGMYPYGWEGETCPDWQSTWEEN